MSENAFDGGWPDLKRAKGTNWMAGKNESVLGEADLAKKSVPPDFTLADLEAVLEAIREGLWTMDKILSVPGHPHPEATDLEARSQMRKTLQRWKNHPLIGTLPVFAVRSVKSKEASRPPVELTQATGSLSQLPKEPHGGHQ